MVVLPSLPRFSIFFSSIVVVALFGVGLLSVIFKVNTPVPDLIPVSAVPSTTVYVILSGRGASCGLETDLLDVKLHEPSSFIVILPFCVVTVAVPPVSAVVCGAPFVSV